MKNTAYTVIELMMTVIILSVIASVSIPNYRKMVERTDFSTAVDTLEMVHAAQELYYSMNNTYIPETSGSTDWGDIQNALNLDIIADTINYACTDTSDPDTFSCTGTRNVAGGFVITVTEAPVSGSNPTCTANCPT